MYVYAYNIYFPSTSVLLVIGMGIKVKDTDSTQYTYIMKLI